VAGEAVGGVGGAPRLDDGVCICNDGLVLPACVGPGVRCGSDGAVWVCVGRGALPVRWGRRVRGWWFAAGTGGGKAGGGVRFGEEKAGLGPVAGALISPVNRWNHCSTMPFETARLVLRLEMVRIRSARGAAVAPVSDPSPTPPPASTRPAT